MSAARLTRLPFLRSFVTRLPVLPLTSRQLTKPAPVNLSSSYSRPTRPVIRLTSRSFSGTSSRRNSSPDAADPRAQTLSARLKRLIKEYGWHALGVYIILSAVDFTVAFGLINFIGAAHVARFTAIAKAYAADYVPDIHISMP